MARLVRGKGLDVLLEALQLLERRRLSAELVIAGEGPDRTRLERRVRELGLEDGVQLAGAVGQDRIRELYAEAQVFCLPSFSEGVPVVLMEAMAMGLPVVATRITGCPSWSTKGARACLSHLAGRTRWPTRSHEFSPPTSSSAARWAPPGAAGVCGGSARIGAPSAC